MQARRGRAVGLLGARPALDDRVDGLEVARVRGERDRDLAGARAARRRRAPRWYFTSPVPPSGSETTASIVRSPSNSRRIVLVGAAERVREHVEPAAVRHPEHDLVRAGLGGELDRLVEHRHEHVEALDRELLLAEERALEVPLEALDLGEALEQRPLLLGRERLAVAARLDRLAQPDALLVVGDVLDLVGDRPAVGLEKRGERSASVSPGT